MTANNSSSYSFGPIATQREALPNDVDSLIRRLGQELSCSICLSVFENPTMTPCNHTFCQECIERAVTMTKKSSTIPMNQCPICKSKAPKRSLNPCPAAARLCQIYESIVREYSEMKGGDEDWIHEAGIRGSESYYTGAGQPLENLSQLYPYPEKPKSSDVNMSDKDKENQNLNKKGKTSVKRPPSNLSVTVTPSDNRLHHINELSEEEEEYEEEEYEEEEYEEEEEDLTQMSPLHSPSIPSSPLIHTESYSFKIPIEEKSTQYSDRLLVINTQELERLAAMNESIDRELAELDSKLAGQFVQNQNQNNNNINTEKEPEWNTIAALDDIHFPSTPDILKNDTEADIEEEEGSVKTSAEMVKSSESAINLKVKKSTKTYKKRKSIIPDESKDNVKEVTKEKEKEKAKKAERVEAELAEQEKVWTDRVEAAEEPEQFVVTTTAIKDENSILLLTKWTDTFSIQLLPDLSFTLTNTTTTKSHPLNILVLPTSKNGLIVQKRTMKYFEAVLRGSQWCRIVSFDWISACLKAGKLLSYEQFLVKGDEIGIKDGRGRGRGRSRVRSLKNTTSTTDKDNSGSTENNDLSRLFSSFKFYFYGHFFQPPPDQLEKLILLSGSSVIQNVQELSRGSIVLCDPSSQVTYEQDAEIIRKYPIVGPTWILDSISSGRVLDYKEYLIL